jgi:hypothetical protein
MYPLMEAGGRGPDFSTAKNLVETPQLLKFKTAGEFVMFYSCVTADIVYFYILIILLITESRL